MQKKLILHSHPVMRSHIESGNHKLSTVLRNIFEGMGFGVHIAKQDKLSIWKAKYDGHYHIFHLGGADGTRSLNMRKAYFDPFWTIEKPHTRHWGRIAHKAFIPGTVGPGLALPFFKRMQERHIENDGRTAEMTDYVLVPMQGKLCKQRAWQYADLATMVKTIREQDPDRQIILKPHPRESYNTEECDVVRQLSAIPNVQIVETPIQSLLANCAYVVTQNSAVAFEGILFRKPAILFARSDFHHIFPVVKSPKDAFGAFNQVHLRPFDFEKYLYWYLQMNCANVSRPTAPSKVLEMLYEGGWTLPAQSAAAV